MRQNTIQQVEPQSDYENPTRSACWEVLLHGRQKGLEPEDFLALQTCKSTMHRMHRLHPGKH